MPYREFPKNSQAAEGGFPIGRGTAKGRATGPTTHEARFNVASDAAQTREARPRQFPCLGAVAPKPLPFVREFFNNNINN